MKKLILTIAITAFAVAAWAEQAKSCTAKPACADTAKACPFAKSDAKKDTACCKQEAPACCKAEQASAKKVVQSPKAAGEARK